MADGKGQLRTAHLGAVAALAALAGATACGPPQQPQASLERLFPALGEPQLDRLFGEQRPFIALLPGERRDYEASLAAGDEIFFALRLLDAAPSAGQLRFTVTLDGAQVYERRTVASTRPHWWYVSLKLDDAVAGSTLTQPRPGWWEVAIPAGSRRRARRLAFAAQHVRRDGTPIRPAEGAQPWIAMASPRITRVRETSRRRVLVWISQDTARADHLSAFGYQRATTPLFDERALNWVVFERAMAPASWTLPSMISQFTSLYPSFHGGGLAERARDVRADHPTIFERLADSGFTVLGVSANEFISGRFHTADGFDALWFDTEQQASSTNALALRALDEWGGGDLALFVHYMDPHAPYSPPEPYFSSFADPDYPRRAHQWVFNDFGQFEHTGADVRQLKDLYDGELAYTDSAIESLLGELTARGLLDQAVLVYSADHGEEFQEHGGWGHGRNLNEEVLHVPFALRVPGVAPRRIDEPITLIDLAPTVLDALGVETPASYAGVSLIPLMKGGPLPERLLFSETERTPDASHHVAVRRAHLKYVAEMKSLDGEGEPGIRQESLFDLSKDPGEKHPVESGPELAPFRKSVEEFLFRASHEVEAGPPIELSEAEKVRLRALGYIR